MPSKIAVFTAFVAAQGSYWANGEPAIYRADECVLAAHKDIPLGTIVLVDFPLKTVKCVVKDRIGKPDSKLHFDLMVQSRSSAVRFGRRNYKVRF